MRVLIIFSAIFLSSGLLYAKTINYQSKPYRPMADSLMKDNGQNARFLILLSDVPEYLPIKHNIKRRSIWLLAHRMIPGKSMLGLVSHYSIEHEGQHKELPAKALFASLNEERPHTYVVLPDRLIFTESTDDPIGENLKDKFTKHCLLSGLRKRVNYSGEFHVFKNTENQDIFVVFDNSSGTYQPKGEFLPKLQELLDANFNDREGSSDEKVYFVTKSFNQKIDKAKLFAHEKDPYKAKIVVQEGI